MTGQQTITLLCGMNFSPYLSAVFKSLSESETALPIQTGYQTSHTANNYTYSGDSTTSTKLILSGLNITSLTASTFASVCPSNPVSWNLVRAADNELTNFYIP